MNIVIAILSPGTMGSALAARLLEHGARVLTSLDGRSAETVDRACAVRMENASLEMIAGADLVLSIVPPSEALNLAKALAKPLRETRFKPAYIDCNAISPGTKTAIASILADTGCDFLDGAIVGSPPQPGQKGPRIYVSGDKCDRVSVLGDLGLDLRRIEGPVGAAAALKMTYAGINKGIIALGAAMILAASRSGASPALYQELSESLPELLSRFKTGIPDMYPKAYRWVAEMREIAAFVAEDQATAGIFEAAARLYDRLKTDIADQGKERAALDGFFQSG